MNSDQLYCALREDECLSRFAKGVFPADKLPRHVNSFPSAYVCNTDPSDLPGKHWVVFWFQSPTKAEFYDSFGRLPECYAKEFVTFLELNAQSCVYNNEAVQSTTSDSCGYHVLFYLLKKCQNVSMKRIVNVLKQCRSPDAYVYDFVTRYFNCI